MFIDVVNFFWLAYILRLDVRFFFQNWLLGFDYFILLRLCSIIKVNKKFMGSIERTSKLVEGKREMGVMV